MRHPPLLRMRPGFVDPGTIAMVALLAVGAISLATTSRALEEAVRFDAATSKATPDEPTEAESIPEEPPDQPPDPSECRDVLKEQIGGQLRELTRLEKLLRKQGLAADLQRVGALRAKFNAFATNIKRECTREHLQDYYDEQLPEEVDKIRCKADLPQQFKEIERELKRIDRQATPKRLAVTGLDPEKFTAHLGIVRQALADAKAAVARENCEDAHEAMQPFWEEGKHPGEINSVAGRLYELGSQLKRVKDPKVRALFQEVIQPVIDEANDGDFREANQALNDVFDELQQMLNKVISSRRYRGYESRLEKLRELLQGKFGDDEETTTPSP